MLIRDLLKFKDFRDRIDILCRLTRAEFFRYRWPVLGKTPHSVVTARQRMLRTEIETQSCVGSVGSCILSGQPSSFSFH